MGILTYIKLGLAGLVILSVVTFAGWVSHVVKERNTLLTANIELKQLNVDNAKEFDKYKADMKKTQDVTSRVLNKNLDINKKVEKAHQEINNATPQPITPNLSSALDRVRELRKPTN